MVVFPLSLLFFWGWNSFWGVKFQSVPCWERRKKVTSNLRIMIRLGEVPAVLGGWFPIMIQRKDDLQWQGIAETRWKYKAQIYTVYFEFGWWMVLDDDLKLGDVSWFHTFWSVSDIEIWVVKFWEIARLSLVWGWSMTMIQRQRGFVQRHYIM